MEKSYLIVYQSTKEELEKTLRANNMNRFIILNAKVVAVYTPSDFDENILFEIEIIAWWQRSTPMSSLINITDNLELGQTVATASNIQFIDKNPYISATGKNVVVAIIDSGIDYLHPDFINKDRTTKIVSIWDQESTKGNPPKGLLFGTEFTREDINKAIKENDSTLSEDKIGTGTYAAGISSGRGNLNSNYRGIALDSELVVVKLREYRGPYDEGKISYQTADFLAAIKYLESIALSDDKYLIINLSVGKSPSPAIEVSLLESFDFLNKPGVIMVGGAGNEGNTDIHHQGKIINANEPEDILIQVGNQKDLEIILYIYGPDKVGGQLISPSGEISNNIQYSPEHYPYEGIFNLEATKYEIQYVYPWIETGYEKFFMLLKDVKPGVWTFRVNPEFIIEGNYEIYLPNKKMISSETRFLAPNPASTISSYATLDNVITVGAYNDMIDSMWIGSSKGPLQEGRIKPDIVAPGVDIISTYRGQTYNTGTGTGVSSSIVSGILAVLIEYITEQQSYTENTIYTAVLKTYLILGATKLDIYKYPNPTQGYGILDLQNTIVLISETL